jgi:hypothetical protein
MLDEIPEYLSISLAAKLCGTSTMTFKRTYIETGAVQLYYPYLDPAGSGRQYIIRAWLETAVGRKFSLADCQAADAKLEKRREYQRAYAIAHRQPGDLGPRKIPDWVRAQLKTQARYREEHSA